ncbi:hypothetical protein RB195_004021 [Necator americanus]|uniref:Uncharacterized protein n=1 Tax=Necator americanus TaxID=51031 RepID=A0ABR1BHR4_NECAM
MLLVAFCTIYDFFDEITEFYQKVDQDIKYFTKYASDAKRTMIMRPRMTERDIFEAVVRVKRSVAVFSTYQCDVLRCSEAENCTKDFS